MAIAFLQGATSSSDLTTYTFSSQNLGTAAGDRVIIACIGGRSVGSLVSASIGGVSADIRGQTTNSSNTVAIVTAAVPSGTTGDVVFEWSEDGIRAAIALYRATALATAVPFDIHTSIATDPTAALNVPAGGFGIAVSWAGFSAGTTSWTGLTEDYDVSVETSGGNFSSAHDSFVSAQSGLTVTANSSLDTGSVGVFASWAATSSIVVPRMIHHMRMQGVA